MAGPWEKYQRQDAAQGPWTRYQSPATPQAAPQRNPDGTYGQAPEGYMLDPQTGGYTSREGMARNMQPTRAQALATGGGQGVTFGWGDEIAGLIGGDIERERMRATVDASRRDHPGMTLAGEIGGAVAVPGPAMAAATTVPRAAAQGAALGGAAGALYGAGVAEDGEKTSGAIAGGATGALFGAGANAAINVGTRGFRRLFNRSQQRPTVENLRTAKNAAYKAVEDSGEVFTQADMQGLLQRVQREIADVDYVPEVDRQTFAALKRLESAADRDLTIGQLDRIRQDLWRRYQASGRSEQGIMSAIDAIDEMVDGRAGTSALMDAARAANSRFKKAELLEDAFVKAQDQTSATGSGGNILNKYRQAVTNIINNPRQARWFTEDEISVMRQFVHGDVGENILRRIGKLSPSGNGLMLALNLFGAAAGGAPAVAITGLASGAKAIADRGAREGAEGLLQRMATGVNAPQASVSVPMAVNALSGLAGARSTYEEPR